MAIEQGANYYRNFFVKTKLIAAFWFYYFDDLV